MDSATDTTNTTVNTDPASPEWAPYTTPPTSLPALLQGFPLASETLVSAVAALEALILEGARLGCLHSAAEVEFGSDDPRTSAAEETWQAAKDREEEATWALLDESPCHPADVEPRVTAFLRARNLYATQNRNWRQVSAREATENLKAQMPGSDEELGDALAFMLANAGFSGSPDGTGRDAAVAPAIPTDPAAADYVTARKAASDHAHALNGSKGFGAGPDDGPAVDAMLASPPSDMAGVAIRLGHIISEAWVHRAGDHDCPHCLDKREVVTPTTQAELCGAAEGQNGGDDALFRALAFLHQGVERLADDYDPVKAMAAHEWEVARDACYAARDASNGEYEPEDEDALFDRYADALEAWETLTPPSLEAMAEVMRASLDFNGLDWDFQDLDCPRTMRDFLDGGDAHTQLAARYYMHALRMTGSTSPALLTAPIAGLFPPFDPLATEGDEPGALRASWEDHHRTAEPRPTRRGEFGRWQAPELEGTVDHVAILQLWHYSRAVSAEAARMVEDYEAMGGAFSLTQQADGRALFGIGYPQDHRSPRREQIEFLATHRKHLSRAIGDIVATRDATAIVDEGLSADAPETEEQRAAAVRHLAAAMESDPALDGWVRASASNRRASA